MKKLFIGFPLLICTFSSFAEVGYRLMYDCKTLGTSGLAKELTIYGNFSSGDIKDQPGLVVISDGLRTKAFQSKISLQGNEHPWKKVTTVISSKALGYDGLDLAISIDLTTERRISFTKKANGLIGLVHTGTFAATKMDNLKCEHLF